MDPGSEYFNCNVVEEARPMMLSSGLSRRCLAKQHASYTKNVSPTSAVGKQFANKTPAKIWFGKKPDLSHLRVFR